MRKISFLVLLSLCNLFVRSQTYVTIPDANFVSWLQTNIPSAMNGNQMDITDANVTGMLYIDLYNLNISDISGIEYFTAAETLYVGRNQISSISQLPPALKLFNCNINQLTSLPALPSTLINLGCFENYLTSLPALPITLTRIDCHQNQLTSLPTLPSNLNSFSCSDNMLTSIPVLPASLKYFSCSNNFISSLPILTSQLINVFCAGNQLTSLPVLPASLELLGCWNNQLTTLPVLPPALENLSCGSNPLGSLPVLPSSLQQLYCSNAQLTALPVLPTGLSYLDCSHNLLTSLPALPQSLVAIDCSYNNISCFPVFPNMTPYAGPSFPLITFNISNNAFTCLPNYIPAMDANTLNYPLCVSGNTTTNPNGCADAVGITGILYEDNNNDCSNNSGDVGLKNIPLDLYDNNNVLLRQMLSQLNGNYFFNALSGTYTVVMDTLNKPYHVQCLYPGTDSLITLTASITLADSIDFAVKCKSGFDVGVQSIIRNGIAFPAQTHTLCINAGDMSQWYGLNCAAGISGTLEFSITGPVTYVGPVSGALTPIVVGNSFTYTISDFGTINNANDFKLIFTTNSNAQAGDMICINATVTPIAGDHNLANNIYNYCYPVANSYDPNIKEVYPVQVQPNFNDWLTYTIHFQNTGNAPAINIRLEDVLDAKLNPETFEVLGYSHPNTIDLNGNVLNIRFPQIMLTDSTSDPAGSIGYIQYRIKPKNNWLSDTIRNSASIYFDFNAPIVTNTAKTYFMTATGLQQQSDGEQIILFPNPTNNFIRISSQQQIQSIELSNITGQVLLNKIINQNECNLQLTDFAEGIYFVKVIYPNGLSTTKKLVKQ